MIDRLYLELGRSSSSLTDSAFRTVSSSVSLSLSLSSHGMRRMTLSQVRVIIIMNPSPRAGVLTSSSGTLQRLYDRSNERHWIMMGLRFLPCWMQMVMREEDIQASKPAKPTVCRPSYRVQNSKGTGQQETAKSMMIGEYGVPYLDLTQSFYS